MADTEIIVKLKLDKTHAERSSEEFFSGDKKRHQQATSERIKLEREAAAATLRLDRDLLKSRIELARALTKARQAEDREARRAATDFIKGIERDHAESNRRIAADRKAMARVEGQIAREQAAAERELTQSRNRAFTAEMAALQKSSSSHSAALSKRQADENALRVLLDKGQIAERARVELNQKLNRQRIDAAAKVLASEDRTFRSLRSVTDMTKAASDSFTKLVGGYASIGTVVTGVMTISKAWSDVAEKQRQANDFYMEALKKSRLGATIKNVSTEAYGAQSASISAKSGLPIAETDQLMQGFEGAAPIAFEKKNLDRKTADDLLGHVATMGARLGGDQEARGETLAMIAANGKINSSEEGLGQLKAVTDALSAGRGGEKALTREFLQVSGVLGGEDSALKTSPEVAALVGVASLGAGGESAGTRALQIDRATRGTTTKQAQALEKEFGIKVNSKEGLEDRLAKMMPKLKELSTKDNIKAYFRDRLDLPEDNAQAMFELMPNYEALKDRLATARNTAKTGGKAVLEANQKYLNSEEGMTATSQAEGEAGKFLQGQLHKKYKAMTSQAEASIEAQDPTLFRSLESFGTNAIGPWIGQGNQADQRVAKTLKDALDERKIENPLGGFTGGVKSFFMGPTARAEMMADTLKANNVDPLKLINEKLSPALDRLNELQKEANDLAKQANKDRQAGNQDRKEAAKKPLGNGAPRPIPAKP